jgi:N-acetylglucosamine-6-phosphate deacetylase
MTTTNNSKLYWSQVCTPGGYRFEIANVNAFAAVERHTADNGKRTFVATWRSASTPAGEQTCKTLREAIARCEQARAEICAALNAR